jgi:hypothetical protein
MNKIKELEEHLLKIHEISKEMNIKDIFRNKKFIEVLAADKLGHEVNNRPGGCDAWETIDGVSYPTEYKSCDCSNNKGSFQFHWLSNNVMSSYKETKNMYFIGRNGVEISFIFKLESEKLLPLIEEKATGDKSTNGHKSFNIKQLKDLGATLAYSNNC